MAFGIAVLLTACGPGAASRGGVVVEDAVAMQEEYRAEIARLSWPPHQTPPPRANQGDERTNYQVGVGAASADFNYLCAWIGEWLNEAAADPVRARGALLALDATPTLPVWPMLDSGGHEALLTAIASAHNGVADPLREQYAALSCQPIFGSAWRSDSPAPHTLPPRFTPTRVAGASQSGGV